MHKKIYIYTKNHNDKVGIRIHIEFIKKIFKNHKIILSKKIHDNSINIFIENFKKDEVKSILKKKKNIKLILLLTEFLNSKAKIFNCFELNNHFFRYIPFQYLNPFNLYIILNLIFFSLLVFKIYEIFYLLAIFNTYIFLSKISRAQILIKWYKKNKKKLYKRIIKDKFSYRKSFFHKLVNLFEYYLLYSMKSTNNLLRKINTYLSRIHFFQKMNNYQYFKERYLNCQKILRYADIVLVTHPSIFNDYKNYNKNIYYLLPKIEKFKPNLLKNKKKIFKFSGEYSLYRRNYFKKMFQKIEKSQNKNSEIKKYMKFFKTYLKKYRIGQFIDIAGDQKYTYSFHPRKNDIWHYSSPIRYLEAIEKGEIPIVTDNFHDFFTKNLSINIKNLFNYNKHFNKNYQINVKLINKKLKVYNEFQKINELKLKKSIL